MGRQIQIHMLADDVSEFLAIVRSKQPVICTPRDSNVAEVSDSRQPSRKTHTWCLWNQAILPELRRELVTVAVKPYYRIDSAQPVIEWWIGQEAEWDGRPALLQGRLYATFENPHDGFRLWFDSLVRWIRKNYKKNPVEWMGGYIGRGASQWHRQGGLLLPHFAPPITDEWKDRLRKQHSG